MRNRLVQTSSCNRDEPRTGNRGQLGHVGSDTGRPASKAVLLSPSASHTSCPPQTSAPSPSYSLQTATFCWHGTPLLFQSVSYKVAWLTFQFKSCVTITKTTDSDARSLVQILALLFTACVTVVCQVPPL